MTKRLTLEELLEAPAQVSLINEPLEPEPEIAEERPKLRLVVNNERKKEPNHVH